MKTIAYVLVAGALCTTASVSGANPYGSSWQERGQQGRYAVYPAPSQGERNRIQQFGGEELIEDERSDMAAKDGFKTNQDKLLLQRIRNELAKNPNIDDRQLSIFVTDQEVRLSGRVPTEEQLMTIEEIVLNIRGVKDLDNRLQPEMQRGLSPFERERGSMREQERRQRPGEGLLSLAATRDKEAQSSIHLQASNNPTDQKLLEKIQKSLNASGDARAFNKVELQIKNQEVTLRGTVDNEQARKLLKRKIEGIQGIKRVEDRLTIRNSRGDELSLLEEMEGAQTERMGTTSPDDIALKTDIENELKGGFFTKGFPQIQVKVQNGRVTLSGSVENDNEAKELRQRVEKIKGVKSIDDQVTIKNAMRGKNGLPATR